MVKLLCDVYLLKCSCNRFVLKCTYAIMSVSIAMYFDICVCVLVFQLFLVFGSYSSVSTRSFHSYFFPIFHTIKLFFLLAYMTLYCTDEDGSCENFLFTLRVCFCFCIEKTPQKRQNEWQTEYRGHKYICLSIRNALTESFRSFPFSFSFAICVRVCVSVLFGAFLYF